MDPSTIFRRRLWIAGWSLLLFALVGYATRALGILNPVATPFLWFDPVENAFHLVLGAVFLAAVFAAALWPSVDLVHRPLLLAVSLLLLAVAVAGLAVAGHPSPNLLGITNVENPFENVFHWVIGFDGLTFALWVPSAARAGS